MKVKKSLTSQFCKASDSAYSDGELASLCQAGDKAAFITLVARHQGMVTGVTLAILGDFAMAEDAAQEAFVTAWKKIGSLSETDLLSERRQRNWFYSGSHILPDISLPLIKAF